MREEYNSIVRVPPPIDAVRLEDAVDSLRGLPVGAHVTTSRRGYHHHGIYVGGGNVVHYAGWTRGWHRGPVEEIPLDQFTCGGSVWVRRRTSYHFDSYEVVRRARSRVGENHYRVFSNNCEHFCEWCLHGQPRSYQVEALLSLPTRVLESAVRFVAKLAELRMGIKLLSREKNGRSGEISSRVFGNERGRLPRRGVFDGGGAGCVKQF